MWIIPTPGIPRGTPGNSNQVNTVPGVPSSSAKYRWYASGMSKLTVFFTMRRPSRSA